LPIKNKNGASVGKEDTITPEGDKGDNKNTHDTCPSPFSLNVNNPERTSKLFCAMLLLSVLCDPVCTSPYPFTDGMECTTPSEVRTGLKALKSVTNAPLGREKYPTAPREIGEGVQRGSVTA
jgi:hypothetical protein